MDELSAFVLSHWLRKNSWIKSAPRNVTGATSVSFCAVSIWFVRASCLASGRALLRGCRNGQAGVADQRREGGLAGKRGWPLNGAQTWAVYGKVTRRRGAGAEPPREAPGCTQGRCKE